MKQSLHIFYRWVLLASLTVPVMGTSVYIHVSKQHTRHMVKERFVNNLHEDALVELRFTPDQIATEVRWEHAREFEYAGQMYDVVTHTSQDGYEVYWCWPDDVETALNRQLEQLIAHARGNAPDSDNPQERLMDFMQTLFFAHDSAPADGSSACATISASGLTYFPQARPVPEPPPPRLS